MSSQSSKTQQRLFIAADSVQQIPINHLFSVLFRRKTLIVLILIALNLPALFFISQLPPYFTSTASVLVQTTKNALNDLQASMSNITVDAVSLRTQADIIQSPALALKVVKVLKLDHALEFTRELDAPPSIIARTKGWIQSLSHEVTPERKLTVEERQQLVATMLQRKLTVGNVGRSYIIDLTVRTGNSQLSADIANAYADFYVNFNQETKQAAMNRGAGLLDKQIEPLQNRVRDAEIAVENFRESNGLLLSQMSDGKGAQDGTTVPSQQLAQINSQLSEAVANLAQKEAGLSAVAGAQQRGGGAAYGIPQVVASPLIQRLREQEAQVMTRMASLNAVPGNDNPLLRSTNLELTAVRRQINLEVASIVDSLRSEVTTARARRDSLQASLAGLQKTVTQQNQAGVMLKQLESQAEASRKIYREFLSRYEQTMSQSLLQEAEASIVSVGLPSLYQSGPPKGLFAAVSVLVSSMLAVFTAVLVDRSRGRYILNVDQLQNETGLQVLGVIPNLRDSLAKRRQCLLEAHESLRFLHAILRQGLEGLAPQIVMITSALPREGKTWFSASFAANAGREGERVLLIDCNRHSPGMPGVLGLHAKSDSTTDGSPFILRRNVLAGVDLITFKSESNRAARDGIRGLLKAAREHYGLILLDTPPVLASADAADLASEVDGIIVVVKSGTTPATKVQSAIHLLGSVKACILGAVLTQARHNSRDSLAGMYGDQLFAPRLTAGS